MLIGLPPSVIIIIYLKDLLLAKRESILMGRTMSNPLFDGLNGVITLIGQNKNFVDWTNDLTDEVRLLKGLFTNNDLTTKLSKTSDK